jgi:GAF domain-containing protein
MRKSIVPYHLEFLATDLAKRKQVNSRYSLRAYARYLGFDPSALSRILAGKQELSLPFSLKVIRKLRLSLHEKRKFLASVSETRSRQAALFLVKNLGDSDLDIGSIQLSQSERRGFNFLKLSSGLDSVFFLSPDPAFAINYEEELIYANEALGLLMETKASELIGMKLKELRWPNGVRKLIYELYESTFSRRIIKKVEFPWPHPTHGMRYYEHIFYPLLGVGGAVYAVASVARDITEHRDTRSHLDLLAVIGNIGSSAANLQMALTKISRVPLNGLADWCVIHITNHGNIVHYVESAQPAPKEKRAVEDFFQKYPFDPHSNYGYLKVINTGTSQIIREVESSDISILQRNCSELRLYCTLKPKSIMCVPIIFQEEVIGAITLLRTHAMVQFSDKDLWVAQKIAQHAATIFWSLREQST